MSVKGYTSKYLEDLEKRRLKEDMRAASFGGTGDTMPGEQVKTPLSDTELLSLLGGNGAGAGGGGGGGGGSSALSSSPVKDEYVPPSSLYDAMKSPKHQNTDDTDELSNLMARGISFDQDGKMKVGNKSTVHGSDSGAYHGGGGRSYTVEQKPRSYYDTGSLDMGELSRLLSDFPEYKGNVNALLAANPDIADKFGKQVDNRLDSPKKTNNPTVTYKEEALKPDAPGGNGTKGETKGETEDEGDTLYALMNEGVRNVIDDTLGRYAANTGGRASSAAVTAATQAGGAQVDKATDELKALMSGDDGTETAAEGTDETTVGTDDEMYDAGFVESYLDRVLGSDATDHLGHMKDVVLELIDENYGSYLMEKLKQDYPMSYEDRFAQILLYLEDNNLVTEAKALEMIKQAGMDKYLGE